MAKHKPTPTAEERAKAQPTVYTFNFNDVPVSTYTNALKLLFANPDFTEDVEKRNRMVKSARRMRRNSREMLLLIKSIQQHDRKLADMLYAALVLANLYSRGVRDVISFSTLLKYYVDYSKPGMRDNVNKLAANLDKITFLADMLESLLVDVKSDMRSIFGPTIEFTQFDAVVQVLTQLRGFFNSTRSSDTNSPEAQLYMDYSDSINDYLYKRLKTYTEKYRKMHPASPVYTATDMVNAIHEIFRIDTHLAKTFIQHTESGGSYIDPSALAGNLTPEQMQIINNLTGKVIKKDLLDFSFCITDAVMKAYTDIHKK